MAVKYVHVYLRTLPVYKSTPSIDTKTQETELVIFRLSFLIALRCPPHLVSIIISILDWTLRNYLSSLGNVLSSLPFHILAMAGTGDLVLFDPCPKSPKKRTATK